MDSDYPFVIFKLFLVINYRSQRPLFVKKWYPLFYVKCDFWTVWTVWYFCFGFHYNATIHVLFMLLVFFSRTDVSNISIRVNDGCFIRDRNCLPFASTCVHIGFWWDPFCSSFWFSVVCICFVCLRSMSYVTNVASFSGLSILDCPFGFVWIVHSWLPLRCYKN